MKSSTNQESKENPKLTLVYIDEDGENEISFDTPEEAQQWLAFKKSCSSFEKFEFKGYK